MRTKKIVSTILLFVFFDLWDWVDVYDKFNTRIYYAAKRHGLTFSRPIEYRSDAADLKPVMDMQKVIDMLQSHSLFEALETNAIQRLASAATRQHYSEQEIIAHQGEPDDGFYIIQAGEVILSVSNETGVTQDMVHLQTGDFFGELALLQSEPNPMTARAVTDVDLLVINGRLISQLIESNPQFAQELNLFIEKRQMLVDAIIGTKNGHLQHTLRQDWIDVVKRL